MTRLESLPDRSRFLYGSVSQAIRERVMSGQYPPGTRIPTAEELAAEFGVSTITVRRAVRDLSFEGVLVGRQGLGVYVANRQRIVRRLTPDRIPPIEVDMRRAGVEPGIQELQFALVEVDAGSQVLGGPDADGLVYRLDRVLLADGEPVGLDTLWLPRSLGETLRPEIQGHFVMPLLTQFGIGFDHIDYSFEAATATGTQASLLGTSTGFPLLVIGFTPIGPSGVPVLVGHTVTRADRFTYEFCGRPGAHSAAARDG
jgi:GntR family transcriptional regulator